jgi:hypothetical protein
MQNLAAFQNMMQKKSANQEEETAEKMKGPLAP